MMFIQSDSVLLAISRPAPLAPCTNGTIVIGLSQGITLELRRRVCDQPYCGTKLDAVVFWCESKHNVWFRYSVYRVSITVVILTKLLRLPSCSNNECIYVDIWMLTTRISNRNMHVFERTDITNTNSQGSCSLHVLTVRGTKVLE